MGGLGGFGGFGGMPSHGRSSSAFHDDDDDPMGGFSSFGGMPGAMPSGGRARRANTGGPGRRTASPGPRSPSQPSEITKPLKISLEDLYSGTTKRLKIGRKLLNGTTEDKVLEIQVLPGWKSGTKIRYPKAGNEQVDGESQDLVFVVEEKPHERFKREGNDLVTHEKISLVDALTGTGGKRSLETLDGRKVQVTVPASVVKPGAQSIVPAEGMPVRQEGKVKSKGDLIVKWDIVFPDRLTSAQKEGLKKVLG